MQTNSVSLYLTERSYNMEKIVLLLARELNIRPAQAEAALQLLDDGNTVPFIARYRKEATGSLDEEQIRNL